MKSYTRQFSAQGFIEPEHRSYCLTVEERYGDQLCICISEVFGEHVRHQITVEELLELVREHEQDTVFLFIPEDDDFAMSFGIAGNYTRNAAVRLMRRIIDNPKVSGDTKLEALRFIADMMEE